MQALRAFLLLAILGTDFGRTSDTNQDETHGVTAGTHHVWVSVLGLLAPLIVALIKYVLAPVLIIVGVNPEHLIALLCYLIDCE